MMTLSDYTEEIKDLSYFQSAIINPILIADYRLYSGGVSLIGGGSFDRLWLISKEDDNYSFVLDIKNPNLDFPYVLEYYDHQTSTRIATAKTKQGIVKALNNLEWEE